MLLDCPETEIPGPASKMQGMHGDICIVVQGKVPKNCCRNEMDDYVMMGMMDGKPWYVGNE